MIDYNSPKYDEYRRWIRSARTNGHAWEWIDYHGESDASLQEFLEIMKETYFWGDIACDVWHDLVASQHEAELRAITLQYKWQQAILKGKGEDNNTTIPTDRHSAWQLYRKTLLEEKHFKREVVDGMEQSVYKILRRLSAQTPQDDPVKGLVIGNVQSGKTANMAGLMAMAADWEWNMFIILSGTIENLREQTENRLFGDLNNSYGHLSWKPLNHPSKKSSRGDRAQDLNFAEGSHDRFFTVCLKNSTRLKNLIQWLQKDTNKMQQMRILVIDDEADQASVDTLDISKNEKNAINRLITNLVNGYDEKDHKTKEKFCGMNYIGYTATPYANILNDSKWESLYPHNFITTLGISNEYFGPQQIFGVDGGRYDGLDIIREVTSSDLEIIKSIHNDESYQLPDSLKDAICWFCCGVALLRHKGFTKPLSMLIHTSQRTTHHDNIGNIIIEWLTHCEKEKLLSRCENLYEREITRFSKTVFLEQYPDYGQSEYGESLAIDDYEDFAVFKHDLEYLLGIAPMPIMLGDDGELSYHEGIHLCIDNCHYSGISSEGVHLRLAYPDSDHMPAVAPAFIVIGGATLARGLTIEGLISTYFLRSVNQADTLMQMGRWFGYRRGYELIPRIWITNNTNNQFRFLSALDQELRDEIVDMDKRNVSPDDYGPKVKNTPNYRFIRITAKNKMQSAQLTDMDYSGSFNQTYLFDTDEKILQDNLNTVCTFIDNLGTPAERDEGNKFSETAAVWKNVNFELIKALINKYHFQQNLHFGQNLKPYLEWIEKITIAGKLNNWNVIVSGGGKNSSTQNILKLNNISITKVRRTRKKVKGSELPDPKVIDIGVLSDPRDFIADVDVNEFKSDVELQALLSHFSSAASKAVRNRLMSTTPQLIIYVVDRNSESQSATRVSLESKVDLAGLCFNIPGGKKGENYAESITVRLIGHEEMTDNGDIEADEN